MLQINGLRKTYKGGKTAVAELTLSVENGDIYGFIGHNGAGKTTTLRACAGILNFEQGDIKIDGTSIKVDPVLCKSKLAFIPDNPDIYGYMTGEQYLNFICDIYQISTVDRKARTLHFADAFELTPSLGDLISSYSHGMRQKLVLISALVHQPKLLILDEPFVGLDPKASHTLKTIMSEHCALGNAIFFSTHVLDVAEKLCNKIAIIKDGRLIAQGKTKDVRGNNSLESVFLGLTDHE